MKVGILTFHHVANYGAMLQAYALQQAVQRLGHEAELIDYRPTKALAAYYTALFENNPQAESNARRLRRMEQFLQTRMRLIRSRSARMTALRVYKGAMTR